MLAAKGKASANAKAARPAHGPRFRRSRDARLPNFIVIGAMKAGTTSLFHYLQAHPQVFMSPLKEVDFFVEELNWKRGLDWYRKQFHGAGPESLAIGEASTAYTKYPEFRGVPERIATHLPEARLIYIVRNPIDRIRSHYQHRVLIGAERAPIDVAVLHDERYVNCSRHAMQLERYLERFPREKLLLITSEELRAVRVPTMRRIYRFLEIDPEFVPETIDREYYRTEERANYPRYAWWIRRTVKRYVPAGKRIKELIDLMAPASIGRHRGAEPSHTETRSFAVPEQLRNQLVDLLRDDVAKLRSYMPEGFDGWGIA
jgi:hypothetical protein